MNLKEDHLDGKKLMMVVYSLQSENVLFAHQKTIVEKLAKEFSNVFVLSIYDEVKNIVASSTIPALGCGWRSKSKIGRVVSFVYFFFKQMWSFKPDIVFYHMTDTHCALVSPLSRFFKAKQVLWYAHTSKSLALKISYLFVDNVITSTRGSCPVVGKKVITVGQSVDGDKFKFQPRFRGYRSGVSIGRLDESKRIPYIVKEFDKLVKRGVISKIHFFGEPSNDVEKEKWISVEEKLLSESPWFSQSLRGKLQHSEIPARLTGYDFFVHAFQGSLDKTLIEATLLGIPVITINSEYLNEFGNWPACTFKSTLLEQFIAICSLNSEEMKQLLLLRRSLAVQKHGIDQWVKKVKECLET